MVRRTMLSLLAAALLLAGCASPKKLARQSDSALSSGNARRAYELALRAVEKDPNVPEARRAYERASQKLGEESRARVRAMAEADSVAAAGLALEYVRLRREVAEHDGQLREDSAWRADEARLYATAARTYYRNGVDAMRAKRPKAAYEAFAECRRYIPGYSDAATRQQSALEAATTRVAVLPFENGVGVRGLSEEIGARTSDEVARACGGLTFTRFISRATVEGGMTLAEARSLSRAEAVALGRRLGADRVVTGRFVGLRSTSDRSERTVPFVRQVEITDADGVKHTKFQEGTFTLVRRVREVTMQSEVEVLDVRTGAVVGDRSLTHENGAHVLWTDFRPEGESKGYYLVTPDARKSDPAGAKRADSQWQEAAGSWTLPALVEKAQKERSRTRYATSMRPEFYGDTRGRPVWLADLPGEDELAFCAVRDVWKPVAEMLRELDAQD